MNDDSQIIFSDGSIFVDETDYDSINTMTDEEVIAAAKADPDAQPITFEQEQRMRRISDLPGNTIQEKLRSLSKANKKLVSIRYDLDIISYYRSKGKGYQKIMNNVLREYMNKEMKVSA